MPHTETEQLQADIRQLLKEIGWDLHKLAREIALEDRQSDLRDDLTPEKEYEKLKKALNRPNTKIATLHFYLNFIIEHNQKRQLYKMPRLASSFFSQEDQTLLAEIRECARLVFSEKDQP